MQAELFESESRTAVNCVFGEQSLSNRKQTVLFRRIFCRQHSCPYSQQSSRTVSEVFHMEQPTARAGCNNYGSCCMAGMHSSSVHALQPPFLLFVPKDLWCLAAQLDDIVHLSEVPLDWSLKPREFFFAGVCRDPQQGEMLVQKALAARSLRRWPP